MENERTFNLINARLDCVESILGEACRVINVNSEASEYNVKKLHKALKRNNRVIFIIAIAGVAYVVYKEKRTRLKEK